MVHQHLLISYHKSLKFGITGNASARNKISAGRCEDGLASGFDPRTKHEEESDNSNSSKQ